MIVENRISKSEIRRKNGRVSINDQPKIVENSSSRSVDMIKYPGTRHVMQVSNESTLSVKIKGMRFAFVRIHPKNGQP